MPKAKALSGMKKTNKAAAKKASLKTAATGKGSVKSPPRRAGSR